VAAKVEVIPEPTAIVGVILASGLGLVLKRKKIVTG